MNCVINPCDIDNLSSSFTDQSNIPLNNAVKMYSLNYTSQNDLLLNNLLVFTKTTTTWRKC